MSTSGSDPYRAGAGNNPGTTYVARHYVVAGEELRRASGWLLFLGILLIILGTFALFVPLFATETVVLLYGFVLLFAGVAQLFAAFASIRWGGFFLQLVIGLLDIVVGLFFLRHRDVAAEILTLLLIAIFFVGGIFRLIAAFSWRFPGWGWTALSGVITFGLGAILWAQWPWASWWIPGLFFGIQMLFYGWSAVMLALAARS